MRAFSILSLLCMAGGAAVSAVPCSVPVAAQTLTSAFGGLSESSKEPIDIESDTLTMFTDEYALFSGNVKAVQGTTTLRAKELKVHYIGDNSGTADNEAAEQPITGGGSSATGSASRSATNKEGGASAKPVEDGAVSDAQGAVDDPIDIESDWLLVHDEEKYAYFKGNVKVVRGDTKLLSKELTVSFAAGDSLSIAAETNDSGVPAAQITKIEAKGDVRALLTPKASKAGTAKSKAETSPGNSEAHSSRSGNKVAGDMTQNAASNSGPPKQPSVDNDGAASQASETATNENRQISKLEATGQVVITSDNDETSTSDWAVYDMASELVTIGGNVVLTQQETVLKGDRLVVDLKTGDSRFENTGTAATGGGRIRALFMPKQGNGKPDDAKRKKRSPSAARSNNGDAAPDAQTPGGPELDDDEPSSLVPEFR